MKTNPTLNGCLIALLLATSSALAQDNTPDWSQAQREAQTLLMGQKTLLPDLVSEVSAQTPQTGQSALFRLYVFALAGMEQEAIAALHETEPLLQNLEQHQVETAYNSCCDHLETWGLAQALLDEFPEKVSSINLERHLIEHLLKSGSTLDQIDLWLAGKPPGPDGFWLAQRACFNAQHGRGLELFTEYTDRIRQYPDDIPTARLILNALAEAKVYVKDPWDLSWLPTTLHPQRATDAADIARCLRRLSHFETAAHFFAQAYETPLTDEEVRERSYLCQVFMPDEIIRAAFTIGVLEDWAKCLLENDRKEDAQHHMVEAARLREEHGMDANTLFAGHVQSATGQYPIENRILDREQRSEEDPQYWWDRARYYGGRSMPQEEEQALEQGLARTRPEPRPRGKAPRTLRASLLRDYALLLKRLDRIPEALKLLRAELDLDPGNAESGQRAAQLLSGEFAKHLRPDDETLWNWLDRRTVWEHTEGRLLRQIFENSPHDDLDQPFTRAEKLAQDADPTRAYLLGEAMTRMDFPKRAVPLLTAALEATQDDELKQDASLTLLEAQLDRGDWNWACAEAIFPDASKRLSPTETPKWLGRIALAAARADAHDDALRIWKTVVNIHPTETQHLEQLAREGLRDDLIALYHDLQQALPTSQIPPKILALLTQPDTPGT